MVDDYFKKIATTLILLVLIILTYLLLKPLLIAVILGGILAFVFLPLYNWLYKKSGSKNLSAWIICLFLIIIIIAIIWYLTPIAMYQATSFFERVQEIDLGSAFGKIFPSFLNSNSLSGEISSATNSFMTKFTNSALASISKFILNIPTLFLYLLVLFFTLFFVLRDKEIIIDYLRSLMPFSREVQNKLFNSSKEITNSVIYGRILTGIAQGIIVGIGFFIFGVENALLLTILACLVGVFPIIGTVIVWLPVSIFLIIAGNNASAFGVVIFGLLATVFESIIQPIILAKMGKMHSSVMLVGMIGGIMFFGILGVILGPLILAYLLIILEIYRDKKISGVLTEPK